MAPMPPSPVVFLLFLTVLHQSHEVHGSEDLHSHDTDHTDHDHFHQHDTNTNPVHSGLRESFLDAKKEIDEKYLDCDPTVIKLVRSIENALKSHDHSVAATEIIELRNFKPSPASTDPCKNFTGLNDDSYTFSHDQHEHQHNHGSSLSSPSRIWRWQNVAIITSGVLTLIL